MWKGNFNLVYGCWVCHQAHELLEELENWNLIEDKGEDINILKDCFSFLSVLMPFDNNVAILI